MNLRNLIMWLIIVLLSVGLFNLFQNPKRVNSAGDKVAFSQFLNEVDLGRVVEVEIQGITSKVFYLMEKLLIHTLQITQI